MNDNITISTFQLFKMFPDQETARSYLETRRWPDGVKCTCCGLGERITVRNVKRHTLARLDSFVKATIGCGITYKELTV